MPLSDDAFLACKLGHRAGDGVVKSSIQRAKVLRADGERQFFGYFGDGLTDVAVVMDDLLDGQALEKQITPVLDCRRPDRDRIPKPPTASFPGRERSIR